MADQTPTAQGLAGLAMSASLMETLLKRGVIEQKDVDPIVADATSYVAAFCTDCGPEVEREALRLLAMIGKTHRDVVPDEAPPIPVVDPASS
jgi:hypothetical protein